MFWPLMKDCITDKDKQDLINFIKTSNRYTNGTKVKELEEQWSKWLGVRHSLFVSSGSTANFLLLSALKVRYNLKPGDKVLVPAMTWVTNVAPIIQLGLKPIFCDVDTQNFSFDLDIGLVFNFIEPKSQHYDNPKGQDHRLEVRDRKD